MVFVTADADIIALNIHTAGLGAYWNLAMITVLRTNNITNKKIDSAIDSALIQCTLHVQGQTWSECINTDMLTRATS